MSRLKLYLFLGIVFISLNVSLNSWGLTESSEARYAEISREMHISGDYINPTLLGIKHFHKPPLTYYITSMGYAIFGVNEFGARFFLQIALIIQLLFVYKIALLLFKDEKLALLSGLIYFSIPLGLIAVRNLTTDAYLTTFIILSVYFWLKFNRLKKYRFLYLFYLSLVCIFETKGPVGLIIPAVFIISHKIALKNKLDTSIHQFIGLAIFLVGSSIWYLAAYNENHGLLDYFLNHQISDRVFENNFKRSKPIWFYPAIIVGLAFPWSIAAILYIKNNFREIISHKKEELALLIALATLLLVLFISTSKMVLYLVPTVFIISLFSAKYILNASPRASKLFSIATAFLVLIVGIAINLIPSIDKAMGIHQTHTLLIAIAALIISVFVLLKTENSNPFKPVYLSVILILLILFGSNHVMSKNDLKINSVKPIAEFIDAHSEEDKTVIVYNELLPSLAFYLNQDIVTISNGRFSTLREAQFQTTLDYKQNLINYWEVEDSIRVENYFDKNTFFIKRKKDVLPESLNHLKSELLNEKEFGKFVVYY